MPVHLERAVRQLCLLNKFAFKCSDLFVIFIEHTARHNKECGRFIHIFRLPFFRIPCDISVYPQAINNRGTLNIYGGDFHSKNTFPLENGTVILNSGSKTYIDGGVFNVLTGEIAEGYTDATLVGGAFNSVFSWGDIGEKFIAIAMFLFAFTTVLGWNHYGTKAWEYLFGVKSTKVYKVIHLVMILFGALLTSSLAWDISDTFNGLMMIPNLIGVIALSGLVCKITRNYLDRQKGLDVAPMISAFPDKE